MNTFCHLLSVANRAILLAKRGLPPTVPKPTKLNECTATTDFYWNVRMIHSRTYLEQLNSDIEEQNRTEGLKQSIHGKSAQSPRPVKPLDDQITELMRTLPPALRNRPWSMAELTQRLAGKYRDRPHAQQVGQALRRLNWRRERRWQKGYDGVRLWVPN
jgi:hypothetical protein